MLTGHPHGCRCALHRCRCALHRTIPDAVSRPEDYERDERAQETLRAARQPHVDVTIPTTLSAVRLRSASGGLESIRLHPLDSDGGALDYARLTPSEARALASVLIAYADSHPSVGEEP